MSDSTSGAGAAQPVEPPAVVVGLAPSWRVVRLAHDPGLDPAASWELLAVWCALHELPAPDPARRVIVADHDPAAPGAGRLAAVGCAIGPGVSTGGEFQVVDTPSVWCASTTDPGGPRVLAEAWAPDGAAPRRGRQPGHPWGLVGLRHWWLGTRCYWPVRALATARA